jgi:hypothetical protein
VRARRGGVSVSVEVVCRGLLDISAYPIMDFKSFFWFQWEKEKKKKTSK